MTEISLRAIRLEAEAAVAEHLAGIGLRRIGRSGEYRWQLGGYFQGWLSVAFTNRSAQSRVQTSALVGVRSEEIEATVQKLGGDAGGRKWFATISTELWNLMPDHGMELNSVDFDRNKPSGIAAQAIVDAFDAYGRPWVEQRATLRAVSRWLEEYRGPVSPAIACRRIAAHYLDGQVEEARRDMEVARREAARLTVDRLGYRAQIDRWARGLATLVGEC